LKSITGLTVAQVEKLTKVAWEEINIVGLPPMIGIREGLMITLIYLRSNRTQADIALTRGMSQPTVSHTISAMTPALATALEDWVPVLDEVPTRDTAYLIDGSLLPCWSWADQPDLYSGKHHTTGVNVQLLATLAGNLLWVSDPLPGSTHDVTALDEHGVLDVLDPDQTIGDKGYAGRGMTTPIKKPKGRDLTDDRKSFNKTVNQTRATIERVIAHFKTWRITHTDYRRPYPTFATTITAVIGLYYYTLSE